MSYKYEGVLKVVRRSRATLIFSVDVPIGREFRQKNEVGYSWL